MCVCLERETNLWELSKPIERINVGRSSLKACKRLGVKLHFFDSLEGGLVQVVVVPVKG